MNSIYSTPTEKIGIHYLHKIWNYYKKLNSSTPPSDEENVSWNYINAAFNTLGIGLEPTLQYVMSENSSFEEFEDWIIQNGQVSSELIQHFNSIVDPKQNIDRSLAATENVLSKKDLKKLDTEGYVIIQQAISKEDCENTVQLIYDTLEADPNDPLSWYKDHPLKQGIMIQLFQNALLDQNRLSDKIRKAYEQIWQRNDLMVSMDRVSFNPPETKTYHFPGPNLHWDVSLKTPIPFGLQGLLYLSDTKKDQGAFTLIPGFHNQIEDWLESMPPNTNPRSESLKSFTKEPLAGKAGDFIIWNQSLPHGSSPNTSEKPRIVQYINYQPIEMEYQSEWI